MMDNLLNFNWRRGIWISVLYGSFMWLEMYIWDFILFPRLPASLFIYFIYLFTLIAPLFFAGILYFRTDPERTNWFTGLILGALCACALFIGSILVGWILHRSFSLPLMEDILYMLALPVLLALFVFVLGRFRHRS